MFIEVLSTHQKFFLSSVSKLHHHFLEDIGSVMMRQLIITLAAQKEYLHLLQRSAGQHILVHRRQLIELSSIPTASTILHRTSSHVVLVAKRNRNLAQDQMQWSSSNF